MNPRKPPPGNGGRGRIADRERTMPRPQRQAEAAGRRAQFGRRHRSR